MPKKKGKKSKVVPQRTKSTAGAKRTIGRKSRSKIKRASTGGR